MNEYIVVDKRTGKRITNIPYEAMDDAFDAIQVLEDFDRAEGFFQEGAYAVAVIVKEAM